MGSAIGRRRRALRPHPDVASARDRAVDGAAPRPPRGPPGIRGWGTPITPVMLPPRPAAAGRAERASAPERSLLLLRGPWPRWKPSSDLCEAPSPRRRTRFLPLPGPRPFRRCAPCRRKRNMPGRRDGRAWPRRSDRSREASAVGRDVPVAVGRSRRPRLSRTGAARRPRRERPSGLRSRRCDEASSRRHRQARPVDAAGADDVRR